LAGYLSVHMAGGASDRHWPKACLINGLTYLLHPSPNSLVQRCTLYGIATHIANTRYRTALA